MPVSRDLPAFLQHRDFVKQWQCRNKVLQTETGLVLVETLLVFWARKAIICLKSYKV